MVVVPYFLLKHHGKTPCSTIFQGKVNPTQCEALTMVCAQVPYCNFMKKENDFIVCFVLLMESYCLSKKQLL